MQQIFAQIFGFTLVTIYILALFKTAISLFKTL
jgi:hypothetical protein